MTNRLLKSCVAISRTLQTEALVITQSGYFLTSWMVTVYEVCKQFLSSLICLGFKLLVDSCQIFLAGIASSSTVGQEASLTFVEQSAIRLLIWNGCGEPSNLIAVEWVSVEGIMDIFAVMSLV